jgi:hypothetical protein
LALLSALAFGRPCRVIAAGVPEKGEDIQDYESGGHSQK